jgi:hypothetical protein
VGLKKHQPHPLPKACPKLFKRQGFGFAPVLARSLPSVGLRPPGWPLTLAQLLFWKTHQRNDKCKKIRLGKQTRSRPFHTQIIGDVAIHHRLKEKKFLREFFNPNMENEFSKKYKTTIDFQARLRRLCEMYEQKNCREIQLFAVLSSTTKTGTT